MEQSVDKRLEAIEILRKWIDIEWTKNADSTGEARVFIKDGCGGVLELFLFNWEAELLAKVLN